MANLLFPRLVRISRPQGNAAPGAQAYSGLSQAKELTIVTAARAHIQPDRQGQAPLAGLPADAAGQPTWKVMVRLPLGTIQKRDVLTDDLGNRYQAISAAWTPLGTTVLAVDLNGKGTPAAAFPNSAWEASGDAWESIRTPWGTPWESAATRWEATTINWEALP